MSRKRYLTPLAAVARGLLAGAVGTVCLDAVQYLKYRRAGGTDKPLAPSGSLGRSYGVPEEESRA